MAFDKAEVNTWFCFFDDEGSIFITVRLPSQSYNNRAPVAQ